MPKTLLLADDSVTIQKVVGISFASEDITLVTVDNGDDAVAKAREIRPDVILADVVMPGKNGYEVCEAVKSDPEIQHIPVLLLTGTFEAFDEERARAAGAAAHVSKPFEAQTLVEEVRRLLSQSSAAPPTPEPAAVPAPPTPVANAPAETSPGPEAPRPPAEESFDFFDDDLGLATAPPAEAAPAPGPAETPLEMDSPDSGGSAFAFGEEEMAPREAAEAVAASAPLLAPAETPAGDHTVAILPDEPRPLPPSPMASPADEAFGAEDLEPIEPALGGLEAELPPAAARERSDSDSLSPLDPTGRPAGGGFDFDFESETPAPPAADPILPVEATDVAQATVLDPNGASGYDVSSSDLGDSMISGPTSPPLAGPMAETPPELPSEPFAEPPPLPSDPLAELQAPLEIDPLAEEPARSPGDLDPLADIVPLPGTPPPMAEPPALLDLPEALADTEPVAAEPMALEPLYDGPITDVEAVSVPEAEPMPEARFEPELRVPVETEPAEPTSAPSGVAAATLDEIAPILKEQLHDTLEKIAWESFSDVTEKIVQQAVERVEKIAWEVIPQLAETLVREEIRKMKGEE